jgi:hypothetical protein
LRSRRGFELGYTGEIAMSEDHLIVAQRLSQQPTNNASLAPMVEKVKLECGFPPGQLLADSGYFSLENLQWLEQEKIDAYLPDSNMAREMNLGKKCRGRARRRCTGACAKSCEVPKDDKPMLSAKQSSSSASGC